MAHEDLMMSVLVLTRDHVAKMQDLGLPFYSPDSPISLRENDHLSLEFLAYILKRNNYDGMAAYSNLDDILTWATFMFVSSGVEYQPLVSTNSGTAEHMTPEEVVEWLHENGVEGARLNDVHYFALNTIWWAIFFSRQIEGSVMKMAIDDALEEEE